MEGSAELLATTQRITREAEDWVLERTVPLYARTSTGDPVPHGTGILLRIADASFVVSASHVLHEPDRELLAATAHGGKFLSLGGHTFQHTEDQRDIDIGFMRLNADLDEAIGKTKSFLRLDQVELCPPAEDDWLLVVGFPGQLSNTDTARMIIAPNPWCFSGSVCMEPLASFTEGVSIAVSLPKEIYDETGEPSRVPALKCISGCGIWRVMSRRDAVRGNWTVDSIRLVGIEHTVLERKAVKGVLATHVISAIRAKHRDLAPAIDLLRQTWH